MINKLFTFTECDEVVQLLIVYENITLIPSIGKHPPGAKFDNAIVDFLKGRLTLQQIVDLRAIEWKYPLTIQVGALIPCDPETK